MHNEIGLRYAASFNFFATLRTNRLTSFFTTSGTFPLCTSGPPIIIAGSSISMMKFLIFCAIVVSVCSIRLSLPTTGLLSSIVSSDGVASSSKESVNCVDGVCSLSSRPADEADLNDNSSLSEKVLSEWASADAPIVANIPASIVPDQKLVTADNVNTLTTMGWSDAEANDALGRFQNDVAKAAQYLEAQDEEIDARQSRLRVLVESGWDQNAAYFVLEKCEGNATAAAEMLENEENRTTSNFNLAVNDMVANEWSERVAREALLAQWNLDQRKALGENVTESAEELQRIHPTLRRSYIQHRSTAADAPTGTTKADAPTKLKRTTNSTTTPATASTPAHAPPTPAKKEDVVFDVTAANFQKVVLESPVPVLLDVYADWCGPCKQLGPVLEQAAIRAGGMFRLAKVNSDQQRAVAEALKVTGLPTVYTVNKGKLNDKFVGMLPQEQLQQYLVRAVTGYGERVQGQEVSEKDLADITNAVRILAGMASIDFKKKEKLNSLVAKALQLEGAFASDNVSYSSSSSSTSAALSEGVKTALRYISNCQQDIGNAKFRTINTTSKAFAERVSGNSAARRLLDIAGFKPLAAAASFEPAPAAATLWDISSSATEAQEPQQLMLVHSNSALLTLIVQRVNEVVNERRFSKMKSGGSSDMPSKASRSYRRPAAVPPARAGSGTAQVNVATTVPVTGTAAAAATSAADGAVKSAGISSSKLGQDRATTVAVSMRFAAAGSTIVAVGAQGAKPRTLLQPKRTLLRHAVQALVESAQQQQQLQIEGDVAIPTNSQDVDFSAVELTFPLPKRQLSQSSPELDMSLEALMPSCKGGGSVSLTYHLKDSAAASSTSFKTTKSLFSRVKSRGSASKARGSGKAHTLFSTGILAQNKQKNNEYFGGDSTVVSAGGDDETSDNDAGSPKTK